MSDIIQQDPELSDIHQRNLSMPYKQDLTILDIIHQDLAILDIIQQNLPMSDIIKKVEIYNVRYHSAGSSYIRNHSLEPYNCRYHSVGQNNIRTFQCQLSLSNRYQAGPTFDRYYKPRSPNVRYYPEKKANALINLFQQNLPISDIF